VIAGDEEATFARRQVLQRFCCGSQLADGPVHQIADDRHQVRLALVDHPHDSLGVSATGQRAEVDVGDHRDPEAVERRIEAAQPHRHRQHVGRTESGGRHFRRCVVGRRSGWAGLFRRRAS
jgi:hypothetical protein